MATATVMINAMNLFEKLIAGYRYTFNELLSICNYTSTELCMALLYLIREGKVMQYRQHQVVYQMIGD